MAAVQLCIAQEMQFLYWFWKNFLLADRWQQLGIVENYPGFEEGIDGFELGEKMQQQAERFGAEIAYAGVEGVDLLAVPKVIHTSEGDVYADSVILAMGAYPRELGLDNERNLRGRGVAYCAACDGMMYKGKDVIIVGGGNSAIADALYLEKICHSVTLIHRRDELRASKVYEQQLQRSKIHFVWNSKVTKILADNIGTGNLCGNWASTGYFIFEWTDRS